jgi:hypothetical protein
MKPYFRTFENPLQGQAFTHYELQTVRDWQAPDGCRFTEPASESEDMAEDAPTATSPVYFAVFGRLEVGGVEHLFDRPTLADALGTLARMGINH